MIAGVRMTISATAYQEAVERVPLRTAHGKAALIRSVHFFLNGPDSDYVRTLFIGLSRKTERPARFLQGGLNMAKTFMEDEDLIAVASYYETGNPLFIENPKIIEIKSQVLVVTGLTLVAASYAPSYAGFVGCRIEYDLVKVPSHKEQVMALRQ